MKRSFCLSLVLLGLCGVVAARAENLPLNADVSERASLSREREKIQDLYKVKEAACYKTFAVNACLKREDTDKRIALAEIKRRELVMNDVQRQKKKADIDLKTSQAPIPGRPATGGDNLNRSVRPSLEGAQRSEEAQKRAQEASRKMMASQAKAAQRAEKTKLSDEKAAKHQKKLRQAAEHKTAIEEKRSATAQPKAAPLPLPKSLEN